MGSDRQTPARMLQIARGPSARSRRLRGRAPEDLSADTKGRRGSPLHLRRARIAADGNPDGAQCNPGPVEQQNCSRISLRSIRATLA
jgi:hypothetical protein